MANESSDNRKSFRFGLTTSVDVMDGAERHAFGTLIDFSRDGVGVRCMSVLNMGRKYKSHIRGVGSWSGVVVRRFDGLSYGVRFDNSDTEKRQIDRILMNMMDDELGASAACHTRPRIRAF